MIKKVLVIGMIMILTSCANNTVSVKDYESKPSRIMVTYGTEEYGETSNLEEQFSLIYDNGNIFYHFNTTFYIPNEDESFTLIDTFYDSTTGYKMEIEKEVIDIDVYELLDYALNKEYDSIFWSNKYSYKDENLEMILIDSSLDSLHFKLYLIDSDYIYEVRVLEETELTIPEYSLSSEYIDFYLVTKETNFQPVDTTTLSGIYHNQLFTITLQDLSYKVVIDETIYEYDFKTDIMCATELETTVCDPEGYTNGGNNKLHEEFFWLYLDSYQDVHYEIVNLFDRYQEYALDK